MMPVKMEVHYKDGTTDSTVAWIGNKYQEISIPNPEKKSVDFVLFDPGREVLKKLSFDRSVEELSEQALRAENMIDRFDALVALHSTPLSIKRETLIRCYEKENFHLVKSEIIDQLSADTGSQATELFRRALRDPDANVRKSVLKLVSPLPEALKKDAEKCLGDFSYLNQELALQNLCLSFPRDGEHYLEATKDLTGWRGLNIRMKWLEIAIANGKTEFLPELIHYSGPQFEFETRMNAFSVMKRLRYMDDTTLANARSASQHWNGKLRDAAKDYLTYFGKGGSL
jgi:aminopeptidase N